MDGRKGPRSQRGRFSILQGFDTKGTLGRVRRYLTDPLRFSSHRVIDSCRWPEAGLQLYPRSVVDTFLWQVRLEWLVWGQHLSVEVVTSWDVCLMTNDYREPQMSLDLEF